MESSPGEFPPISELLNPTTPTNHYHTNTDIENSTSIYTSPILPPQQFTTPRMGSIEPSSDPLGYLSPAANFANTAKSHRFQKWKLPPTEA